MTSLAMHLLERDLVPDFLIRRRIRSLLAARLREEDQRDPERQQQRLRALSSADSREPGGRSKPRRPTSSTTKCPPSSTRACSANISSTRAPIIRTRDASPAEDLDAAEARMLALTCERARLADGERILELGLRLGLAEPVDGG